MEILGAILAIVLFVFFIGKFAFSGKSSAVISEKKVPAFEGKTRTFELGIEAYKKGDFQGAKNFFMIASESGDHQAQFLLGMLLSDGENLPPEPQTAERWMRAASIGGLSNAQAEFAAMLLSGILGKQDKIEGEKWLLAAAQQGNEDAQLRLGSMYLLGHGVAGEDRIEAKKWLKSASLQGNPKAQAYLGLLFADGGGIPVDKVEAYAWLTIAKENGETIGLSSLTRLKNEMTPDEIFRSAELAVAIVMDHKIQPR